MRTHVIFKKYDDSIFFLDSDKNITELLTDKCIMNYTTASSIVGTNPEWKVFHIKEFVLNVDVEFKNHLLKLF